MSAIIAGVDACRAGWLCVRQDNSRVEAEVFPTFQEALRYLDTAVIVAVDIPIGLSSAGERPCDPLARQLLGFTRAGSVVPTPVWSVVHETDYELACAKHRATDGRALSKQAFAILPKILEVNDLIRRQTDLQDRVREIHPELSFAVWNDGRAMKHRRNEPQGKVEREKLIDRLWPQRARVAGALRRAGHQLEDLNDAFAALWTAARITRGAAKVLGPPTPDQYGIKMQVWA